MNNTGSIFTLYIPKKKGASTDFPIIQVIKSYIKSVKQNHIIVLAPGYLSKTQTTTDCFVKEMETAFSAKTSKHSIAVFNGMNGSKSISKTTKKTIREYHEDAFKKSSFHCLPVSCIKLTDHRKMLFITSTNNNCDSVKKLSKKTKQRFLDSVDVLGIFIGSSNPSYSSYFGGKSKKASKGEADIYMFLDNDFASYIEKQVQMDDVILSESRMVPGNNGAAYLKSILEDYLDDYLA